MLSKYREYHQLPFSRKVGKGLRAAGTLAKLPIAPMEVQLAGHIATRIGHVMDKEEGSKPTESKAVKRFATHFEK